MAKKDRVSHSAAEFDLNILESDTDAFRWFLLCYLFGKPIRSETAVRTWRLFIDEKLDSPWAIVGASNRKLVSILREGGYTRYQHLTADALPICMDRLIREYDGSLLYMLESSSSEDEFSKRLQKLHGVGPKVAEIYSRDTQEFFARRVE